MSERFQLVDEDSLACLVTVMTVDPVSIFKPGVELGAGSYLISYLISFNPQTPRLHQQAPLTPLTPLSLSASPLTIYRALTDNSVIILPRLSQLPSSFSVIMAYFKIKHHNI